MRQKIASIAQRLRLPSICVVCNQYHRTPLAVCPSCLSYFQRLSHHCKLCAHPLPDATFLICGPCTQNPPAIDAVFISHSFEEPLRGLLHQFKYQSALFLERTLVNLMETKRPQSLYPSHCLVPIPMHPTQLKKRGFNQAKLLAQRLAKNMHLPCEPYFCKKTKVSAPQASLTGELRRKNLRHAFAIHRMLPYEQVTLVDDVLTTGSTVNELAKVLKKQGVLHVDVWCCARTIANPT